MKLKHILLALISVFISGTMFVAPKIITDYYPTFLSIAMRFTTVALILLPFLRKPQKWSHLLVAHNMALSFNICFIGLSFSAIKLAGVVSPIVILTQLQVPISSLLAYFLFKEYLNFKQIAGIIISLIGVFITLGSPTEMIPFVSVALALLAAFAFAIYNIFISSQSYFKPLELVGWASLFSVPYLITISYILGEEWHLTDMVMENKTFVYASFAICYSVFAVLVGANIWVKLLSSFPVNQVVPYALLVPFFGVICSVIMLDEKLSLGVIIGGVVTVAGVSLITFEEMRKLRQSRQK